MLLIPTRSTCAPQEHVYECGLEHAARLAAPQSAILLENRSPSRYHSVRHARRHVPRAADAVLTAARRHHRCELQQHALRGVLPPYDRRAYLPQVRPVLAAAAELGRVYRLMHLSLLFLPSFRPGYQLLRRSRANSAPSDLYFYQLPMGERDTGGRKVGVEAAAENGTGKWEMWQGWSAVVLQWVVAAIWSAHPQCTFSSSAGEQPPPCHLQLRLIADGLLCLWSPLGRMVNVIYT
ncbi:hypothetical protein FIBSPDRAFT_957261 [Athelia psychrophila]|uniref:Uncharacterized protein n=1 Tax=Athelia psychrophila TaxID=1759441 RepID=A0A166FWJ7_9AGAM|nr:hypothetical protein FIBSPDRAFT_957261 [Fibularhizoctonia sp. CBS 109695]